MSWIKKSSTAVQQVDYEFKALNATDYEMTVTIPEIRNSMMLRIFSLSKTRVQRKTGVVINKGPSDLEEFHVPPMYLKLLNTLVTKQVRIIEKDVRKDGIEIYTSKVGDAKFEREKDGDWKITIYLSGIYIDKR